MQQLFTSKFAPKVDLASLKSNVHKLVPTNLNNLKSKVDKLDVVKISACSC